MTTQDVKNALKVWGPCTYGKLAREMAVPPREMREYLEELKRLGEVQHNWVRGLYSL
jgi:predicted ArsR family transcriptional regulator